MSEWISVNHRLPETDGIYIVCDRRLNGYPWIHPVGFRKVSSSWCELHGVYYDDGYGRYSDQDKFTHWMPMPEPPEVDDHSICGATNLPCIRCNPGGCDNRKEGADND